MRARVSVRAKVRERATGCEAKARVRVGWSISDKPMRQAMRMPSVAVSQGPMMKVNAANCECEFACECVSV